MNKDVMRFTASSLMLIIIVSLMMYLTFVEVPEGNKDIIITILGVLLGAGAAAIPNLFGDSDKEKELMQVRIAHLENTVDVQNGIIETLRSELTSIRTLLIDRHVISGNGIVNTTGNSKTTQTNSKLEK